MSQNINVGDSLIQLEMAQIEEEIPLAVNSTLSCDKYELPIIPFLPDPFYHDWTRFNCDEDNINLKNNWINDTWR